MNKAKARFTVPSTSGNQFHHIGKQIKIQPNAEVMMIIGATATYVSTFLPIHLTHPTIKAQDLELPLK